MKNPFKDCSGGCFKTKETRDSNNNSNESQRGTNFLRDSFRRNQQSQDASPSYHPKTSDYSSVNSSPADSRRLETFSSHDREIADRLQRLLAERQRQETSSSYHPETSDHSSADFRPSQQKVRLKNGSEVLAGDISPIMNSLQEMEKEVQYINIECGLRIIGASTGYRKNESIAALQDKKEDLVKDLDELKVKCKNSNYKIEDKYCKLLQEKNLINEHSGQPSDSVKNIVLSMSQSISEVSSPLAEDRVKLKNGAEEDLTLVKTAMDLLRNLREKKPGVLSELHKFCQDQNYTLDNDTAEVLKSKRLINKDMGKPHKAIENIVLSSYDEKSGELRSPAMPLDELEEKFLANVREKIVDQFLVLRELEKKMGDPGRDFMPFKDNVEKIKGEIKKEFFEPILRDKEALKFIYPNQSDDY